MLRDGPYLYLLTFVLAQYVVANSLQYAQISRYRSVPLRLRLSKMRLTWGQSSRLGPYTSCTTLPLSSEYQASSNAERRTDLTVAILPRYPLTILLLPSCSALRHALAYAFPDDLDE